MNKPPFFSICIPNFNYSNYINITIESVLEQRFEDFEIIVTDNASTDNSWDVIQRYVKKDPRIKAYRNQYNVGFAPNLQRASAMASGEFVILLSSDDVMFPGALQTYHEILRGQGAHARNTVLHSAFDQIDSTGKYLRTVIREKDKLGGIFADKNTEPQQERLAFRVDHQPPLDVARYALQTNKGIGAFLTICYPRALWAQVEGYDTQYFIFPDKAFLLKLLLLEPQYLYVNSSLFGYRIHANNQNSKNAGQAALKHQVDGYMRVINFREADLKKLSMTRRQLETAYIDNLCVLHAFIALKENHRLKAFKILCFAYATFPSVAAGRRRLWVLKGLLFLGPLGSWTLRKMYKSQANVG